MLFYKLQQFLNAKYNHEVIFTKGNTDGVNIVANTFAKKYLKEGDEILGTVTISKKTKSMIFVVCNLECDGRLTASASGVWKILRNKSFPK